MTTYVHVRIFVQGLHVVYVLFPPPHPSTHTQRTKQRKESVKFMPDDDVAFKGTFQP